MKRSPRKGTEESAAKPRGTQEHLHPSDRNPETEKTKGTEAADGCMVNTPHGTRLCLRGARKRSARGWHDQGRPRARETSAPRPGQHPSTQGAWGQRLRTAGVRGRNGGSDTGVSNNPFSTSPRKAFGTCPSDGDNIGKSADADHLRQEASEGPRAQQAVPRPGGQEADRSRQKVLEGPPQEGDTSGD